MTDDQLEAYEHFYEELAAQPELGGELLAEPCAGYDDEKPCLTEDQVRALGADLTEEDSAADTDVDPDQEASSPEK